MLRDRKGAEVLEYLVGAAVTIAVLGVAAWALVNAASDEAGNVQTWITGISVPAAP
jgi:hypothetical protein